MPERIKLLFRDFFCRTFFFGSLLLCSFDFIFLFFTYRSLPLEIPLLYSLAWGKQQLVPSLYIFLLPLSATIFFIVNSVLAFFTFSSDFFLARIFFISSFLIFFLSSFGLWRIVLLVL